MLNIGRLGTDLDGVVDYYTAEVEGEDASIPTASPEQSASVAASNYYLKNDTHGRWVGSLRDQLGVNGVVDPEAFRRLLEGCHPLTGEPLTPGAVAARAKHMKQAKRPRRKKDNTTITVTEAAGRLDLSPRHVRRLLEKGAIFDEEAASESWAYLRGEKVSSNKSGPGRAVWKIPAHEVERFMADRDAASMRPGFDLTLRPVKSVSILWALGAPEVSKVVAEAHREAVDEVIAYYESAAVFSRKRVEGEQLRIETDGMIGAAFDHRTSRSGDPLLHTHVVTFNVTKCADGEWRSLDGTPIYEHAKTGGYLYQAHLRHVLSKRLGVEWTEVVNGCAEVKGIPREVIDAFSKRRAEIECAVAESGYQSARAHQAATLETRHPKGSQPEPPVAVERWWHEAQALGFTKDQLNECLNRAVKTAEQTFVQTLPERFEAMMGEEGLTMMMSTFARRDVLRELAEQSIDECSATELRELVEQFMGTAGPVDLNVAGKDSDLVLTAEGEDKAKSVTRHSTPELLDKEASLLAWANGAFDGMGPVAAATSVSGALARNPELTNEQVSMVKSLTRSGNRLHLVVGDPGSGKTYAARVAVEAFSESGVPVIGAALSADAGEQLEMSIDLTGRTGREAGTVAKLLRDLDNSEHGGFAKGTVLILDEASMVGTRMVYRLVTHLDKVDGSLVLMGDPNQHGSVETGGFYAHLAKTHVKQVSRLTANNRQTDEVERKAIAEFREGQIKTALDSYDGAGKVVRSASLSESYDAMVNDWHADWVGGDRSPMMAGLNSMRTELNARARNKLRDAGKLGDITIDAGGRELAVGDWIVARKNARRIRGKNGTFVKNGSLGTVVAFDDNKRTVAVDFDREGVVTLPQWYVDGGHVDYAYSRTTYGVQGKTHGLGKYQPTDVSSFEEGYVALTRAKNGTRIYIVENESAETSKPTCTDYNDEWKLDSELITKALEKRRSKLMAHDLKGGSDEVEIGMEL